MRLSPDNDMCMVCIENTAKSKRWGDQAVHALLLLAGITLLLFNLCLEIPHFFSNWARAESTESGPGNSSDQSGPTSSMWECIQVCVRSLVSLPGVGSCSGIMHQVAEGCAMVSNANGEAPLLLLLAYLHHLFWLVALVPHLFDTVAVSFHFLLLQCSQGLCLGLI